MDALPARYSDVSWFACSHELLKPARAPGPEPWPQQLYRKGGCLGSSVLPYVCPLSSWSQAVAHVPAIINVSEAGQCKEKIIFKGASEKLHDKLKLMCRIGSLGVQSL